MRKTLSALIIDPELATRLRLKEVLGELALKVQINQLREQVKLNEHLEIESKYDAIFIRSTCAKETIYSSLSTISELPINKLPLVILLIQTLHNSSEYIAEYYLKGVHGFIREPYTIDEVSEVLKLAEEARGKQIDARIKSMKAAQLMIKEGLRAIDEAAIVRVNSDRRGGGFGLRRMRKLNNQLRTVIDQICAADHVTALEEQIDVQIKTLDLSLFKKKISKKSKSDHPGKFLSEVMKDRKLSHTVVADKLKISSDELTILLAENSDITPELAKALARLLGNTPDFWTGLQSNFDNWKRSVSIQ